MLGKKLSDETKRKIGLKSKGRKHTEEAKRKIGLAGIGREFSKETRKKISEAHKGLIFSKEYKRKLSIAKQNMSEETKRKIGLAQKGKKLSEEYKLKLSITNKGEKCNFWRGGMAYLPYCFEWTKDLKDFIKERDGNKCMNPMCGKPITKKNPLGVHHIDYDKKNYIPENLLSLCNSCNTKANFNRTDWKEMYQTIIKQNYSY